jgi:hypothetical protein
MITRIKVNICIVAIIIIEMPDIIVGIICSIRIVAVFPSPGYWYSAFIVPVSVP